MDETIVEMILIDYTYLEPVCPLFVGLQPSKRKDLSNQNRGHLRVPGIYIRLCFLFPRWIMLRWRGLHYKGELLHLSIFVSRWRAFNTADITTCHVPYAWVSTCHVPKAHGETFWDLFGILQFGGDFCPNASMICLGGTEKSSTHLFSRFWKDGRGVAKIVQLLLLETAPKNLNEKQYYVNMYVWYIDIYIYIDYIFLHILMFNDNFSDISSY